jgi:hypothetical protein
MGSIKVWEAQGAHKRESQQERKNKGQGQNAKEKRRQLQDSVKTLNYQNKRRQMAKKRCTFWDGS